MKITLVTEVFPPKAGGAGWSTRALAMGLKGAGHDVKVVTTAKGPTDDGGVPVTRLQGITGGLRRGRMVETFRKALARDEGADVIHAQHSLSALGALTVLHFELLRSLGERDDLALELPFDAAPVGVGRRLRAGEQEG